MLPGHLANEGRAGSQVLLPLSDEMAHVLTAREEEALDVDAASFGIFEESLDMLAWHERVCVAPYREERFSLVGLQDGVEARLHESNLPWGEEMPQTHERGDRRTEEPVGGRGRSTEGCEKPRQDRAARVFCGK